MMALLNGCKRARALPDQLPAAFAAPSTTLIQQQPVVEALLPPELAAYHARAVTARRLTLAVVGDIDPARTLALLEEHLGGLSAGGDAAAEIARLCPEIFRDAATFDGLEVSLPLQKLVEQIREPEGAGPSVDIDAAPEH